MQSRGRLSSVLTFARRHRPLVFALSAGAALVGALLVSRVSFDANVLRLLPQRSPSVHNFQTFLESFGSLDHLYVVFESSGPIGDHRDLIDAYVDRLRHEPAIESVDAQLFEPGKDWRYVSDRALYLLGPEDAATALARFRPPRLEQEIAHARDLLSMPSSDIKALVQQDPLGLLSMMRARMAREKGLVAVDPSQEGYVSADGTSRLVIVKPNGPPFDTDFCKRLFQRLAAVETEARQAAATADPDAGSVTVQAAGAYRVSLEAEQLIKREGIVNAVGSMALLLVIVFAVFRTPRVLLFGSVPMTLAALLALAITGLVQGSLSPATSGSAGMLFGLGIDGLVLLYLRYLEERGSGAGPDEAVARLGGTAASVVLAQMTTAATFFALLATDFPTLHDLGALVGLGILLCCGLTLVLFPAMLPRRAEAPAGRLLTAAWLGRFVTRAALPIVVCGAAATLILAVASTRLRLDTSIEKLQARTKGSLLEQQLTDRFSLPRDVLLVMNEGERLDPLLETDERLEETLAAKVRSVQTSGAGLLLPSASRQALVARAIGDAGTTVAAVERDVQSAGAALGFRAGTFAPFLDRVPQLLDQSARISYDGLLEHGLGSLVSRFVARRGGRYQTVTYLYSQQATDLDALQQAVHDVDPGLRLTGLPVINRDLRRAFLPQFLRALTIGTAVVALLIYVVFRSVRYTLLALLPTAIGFIWSAGLLAFAGVELDLFSLFAAVTFIGIAVDYGIYVLYRYAFEPGCDMNGVLETTGAAIMLACATALVGFGTLVNSAYQPLHVFGIVSIVTLTCCLIASIVLLPALVLQMERWSPAAR